MFPTAWSIYLKKLYVGRRIFERELLLLTSCTLRVRQLPSAGDPPMTHWSHHSQQEPEALILVTRLNLVTRVWRLCLLAVAIGARYQIRN